ncbi:MAG TPA: phosphotransferase family protein [Polyangiaceae bacterium]|jgi:aminoglycoside phosphotransferase (APT) family kinase protein|nr:phosphotransferase family protein [Polyangiaceae bacterium]
MSDFIDRPRDIRQGEELDLGRLTTYLKGHVPELSGISELVVKQFPSGHSNLTYLVQANGREYVLRRPPFGSKVKSAHDMGREYRILSKLHGAYPLAPEPIAFCEDDTVLGANFYVMRRIEGIILRKELPPDLTLSAETLRSLHLNLVDNLARIHGIDYARAGLSELGKPEGYVARQVTGWTKRYADSQTDDIPAITEVAKWLADRLPKESGASLIHNDYKLDNVVLDAKDITKIVGVLDWEMSTLGDPCMDLGTFLGYWVEKGDDDAIQVMRWGPTTATGSLTRREIVERYQEKSGRSIENPVYYYVFGMFKTAVVVQQIYYRYKMGLTKDERFAIMIMGVHTLAQKAAHHIGLGSV